MPRPTIHVKQWGRDWRPCPYHRGSTWASEGTTWSERMTTFYSIPKFRDESGNVVEFKPVSDVPGFSHRVIVNYKAVDYLDQRHAKPSAKTAAFFFQKHSVSE
jgi:hypothetical protein